MAFSLFTACNNDKGKISRDKESGYKDREKDDYSNKDGENKDDKSNKDDRDKKDYSSNDGWAERDRNKFIEECLAGFDNTQQALGKKICPCVLTKVEKKYSSFSDADAKGSEAEGKKMGKECAEGMNINTTNTNTNNDDDGADYSSGGWTSNEVKRFVNGCVSEAEKGGMEYLDAQSYCDCMQFKLAKIYPNAKDVDRLTEADLETPAMKRMIKSCLPGN